jgi:5-methylcytosine-specific restriction protein A
MPTKPPRPCAKSNCPELTTDRSGYCIKHLKGNRQQYDKDRGTATHRGYDARWAEYSRLYRMEHPLCVNCGKQGRVAASHCVDHIVPVSGPDDPLFWEPSNHEALCTPCHSIKTAAEDGAFGNRRR